MEKEAKYTVTLNTTDLIAQEGFFGKAHGPYTGFVVLGFTEDDVQQTIHSTNLAEIAAAIASSEQLSQAARLAKLAKGL